MPQDSLDEARDLVMSAIFTWQEMHKFPHHYDRMAPVLIEHLRGAEAALRCFRHRLAAVEDQP